MTREKTQVFCLWSQTDLIRFFLYLFYIPLALAFQCYTRFLNEWFPRNCLRGLALLLPRPNKQKAMSDKKYFSFSCTCNNYSDSSIQAFESLKYKYLIYGKEVGAEGTPHLQCYVSLISQCSESSIRKKLPGFHIEVSKGDAASNRVYCSKEGMFVELGVIPMSNKRKGEVERERYDRAYESAKAGDFEAIDKDILIRHLPNLKKIRAEHQVVPTLLEGELINEWIYGPPGTGKSTKAMSENPGAYLKSLTKWWDGYSGQETVIIDDMDPYHKSLAQEFKQWGHHFPFPAETKGGSMCIRPKKIVVTSNYPIHEVWEDEVTREAMFRRYKEIEIREKLDYSIFH